MLPPLQTSAIICKSDNQINPFKTISMTILSQEVHQHLQYLRNLKQLTVMRDFHKTLKDKFCKAESIITSITTSQLEAKHCDQEFQELMALITIYTQIQIGTKQIQHLLNLIQPMFLILKGSLLQIKKTLYQKDQEIGQLNKLLPLIARYTEALLQLSVDILPNDECSQIIAQISETSKNLNRKNVLIKDALDVLGKRMKKIDQKKESLEKFFEKLLNLKNKM